MAQIPHWLNTQTLKDFGSWLVDNVAAGVIVGIVVLVIGSIIGSISLKKLWEIRDKKRIYKWLYNETKKFGHKSPYDYNYNPWW